MLALINLWFNYVPSYTRHYAQGIYYWPISAQQCPSDAGGVLPKRQDLPDDAAWTVTDEPWEKYIVAISYCWATPGQLLSGVRQTPRRECVIGETGRDDVVSDWPVRIIICYGFVWHMPFQLLELSQIASTSTRHQDKNNAIKVRSKDIAWSDSKPSRLQIAPLGPVDFQHI